MTDYTKSTNFASKDTLPAGDALKIVKGTEINTEFDNIQTAVATKADSASPTFTGTPAAPTAAAGTSTTQIATTAFLSTLYPVGSIYSSTVSTNPNTLFGFGTWVAFAAGRVMMGNGGGFSAGATGGSADAIVVSHTHTITDGGHAHTVATADDTGGGGGTTISNNDKTADQNTSTSSVTTGISINSTGSSGTNANLQPYVVVYMWNRTV
jgi:hypothetical protein